MSARPSLYLANVVGVRVRFWSVVSDGHAVYRVTSTLDPAVCPTPASTPTRHSRACP